MIGHLMFKIVCICLLLCGFLSSCSNNNSHTKTYRIAKDDSWYPLNLQGKEKNMSAFASELLLEIAKEEDFRFEAPPTTTDSLMLGLDDGEFDAILTSKLPDPYLQERYLFSDPFYRLGPVLVVAASSRIRNLAEVEGKIIGIMSGISLSSNAKPQLSALFIPYSNATMALDDLEKNKIDGIIMDAMMAYIYIKGPFKGRGKVITPTLNNAGLRLMTLNGSNAEKLVESFNDGLAKLKENGQYKALLNKWDLVDTNALNQ